MFDSDEVIERKYRDKATAYAIGMIHGGMVGVIGACISCAIVYISLING